MNLNLDDLSIEELEEFVSKADADKQAFGLELWPEKPASYMRALNCYTKYAREKIEAMKNRSYGRESRARKNEEVLNKIFRTIPEDFRW